MQDAFALEHDVARDVLARGPMSAAAHSFETLFDQSPHVVGHAVGVVPLAGELGDAGPTLTLAAPLATHVLVARRRDPVVHAASANVEGPARCVFVLGEESPWRTWVDYVQGVTVALREHGHEPSGFDLLVRSDLPCRVGLGSSTALVVALLRALRDAYALGFDEPALVDLAHRAEGVFTTAPSRAAIEACVFASDRHALLVEAGKARERIALPDDMEATVVLGNRLADAERSNERAELEAARVEELAAALRGGNADEIGAMLDTLPGPRCDLLATARRHPSVYGARCVKPGNAVVALARRGASLRAA
jgi:galactokinase